MTALKATSLWMQQQETTLAHLAAENQQMTQSLAAATDTGDEVSAGTKVW